jgi:hypothetical protein
MIVRADNYGYQKKTTSIFVSSTNSGIMAFIQ